jgi:hypothetical protein
VGAHAIAFSGDTSGFLAAVGLDGSEAGTTGYLNFDSPLSSRSIFDGVTAGNITVNGVAVAVDPDVDSLASVIASLNGIAGVQATFGTTTGAVLVRAIVPGGSLDIEDETGLLSLVGIEAGLLKGRAVRISSVETASEKKVLSDPRKAKDLSNAVFAAAEALNGIFASNEVSSAYKSVLFDAVRFAAENTVGAKENGVDFIERAGEFEFKVDADRLASALADDPLALDAFLQGEYGLPLSLDVVERAFSDLSAAGLGSLGSGDFDAARSLRGLVDSTSIESRAASLALLGAAGQLSPRTGARYDRTV